MIKTIWLNAESIKGNNDLWIASHALSSGLTVVTNNTKEFERIPRLMVENWVC